jgi:hypothetical protein
VSNAAKHSGASRVEISLAQVDGQVELTVCDDGCGLPPEVLSRDDARAGQTAKGLGLRVMAYRARSIGAELLLRPQAEGGLTVRCVVKGAEEGADEGYFLLSPQLAGPVFLREGQRYVVGRDPEARVRLLSNRVSRRHAELRWEDGGLVVEDLGSTNGTRVNDERVTGSAPVAGGDRLSFGGCEALLREGRSWAELAAIEPDGGTRLVYRGEETVAD